MSRPDLRLLHITDTHLFAGTHERLRGVQTHATLAAVLAHAASNPRPPDAILATGDISQDETRGAYENFRNLLAATGLPVWCLPGNHDAPALMREVLAAPPFTVGGELLAGHWCIALLDSHESGEHGGRLGPAKLARLAALLAEQRERHVLIAIHHHVHALGSRWLDELGLQDGGPLLGLLAGADVRAILAGHVHQASDDAFGGIRQLTTPSTCFQFLPEVDEFAIDTRPPGYRWLDLMPDGSISTEVAWIEPPVSG